jgi:hypothetical protein
VQPSDGSGQRGAQAGGVEVHDRATHEPNVAKPVAAVLNRAKVNLELAPILRRQVRRPTC